MRRFFGTVYFAAHNGYRHAGAGVGRYYAAKFADKLGYFYPPSAASRTADKLPAAMTQHQCGKYIVSGLNFFNRAACKTDPQCIAYAL